MSQQTAAKLKMVCSMFIFGTIGIFVNYIPFPRGLIAFVRGLTGALFLFAVLCIKRVRPSGECIRKNLLWLLLSGTCLGFNWVLLFEAYRYTSVAVSTICYYMAPSLVILAAPIVLKEPISIKKIVCLILSILGMVLVSGVVQDEHQHPQQLKGVLLGLGAAVLYASIALMNKKIHDISAYDKTIVQLGTSAVVMLPYCLLTVAPADLAVDNAAMVWGLLLFVGIVHTGFTYFLYFGAMDRISAQTAAIVSYIDPVVAVLASFFFLKQDMLTAQWIGAILILGAALLSELPSNVKSRR